MHASRICINGNVNGNSPDVEVGVECLDDIGHGATVAKPNCGPRHHGLDERDSVGGGCEPSGSNEHVCVV